MINGLSGKLSGAGRDALGWVARAALLAAVLVPLAYWYLARMHPPDVALTVLLVAAVSAIGVFALLHLRYRRTLERLHRYILEAQEGRLEPLEPVKDPDRFLARLIADYNHMITTLRSMFRTVEECQSRVLNERNKIDAILQSLPGALLTVGDDLRVATVNKQAEDLFGCTQDKLVGRSLFELIRLEEGDREVLRDVFLYKQPVRNQELKLTVGDAERWFSLNLAFLNEQEADMGAVLTLQDITEYRQLQESVATREKLVAMGQLAAGVAHELNTPLGNILGYSQLMQDGVRDPDKLSHFARVISDETRRCSRIVQDLLNYARKEQCLGETCEVNTLLREVIDTFVSCRMRRYNIEVELDLQHGELMVEGGCGQLDIVLTNLMLNAIQALEGVKAPTVTLRTWRDAAGFVHIAVEDNGPGVPPEIRGRIFDPFFSTKEVGSGSGLGLSISQAMLAKRGGVLRHDAQYEGGARFVIKLPAVEHERQSHAGTA